MAKDESIIEDKSNLALATYEFQLGKGSLEPKSTWIVYNPTITKHEFFEEYSKALDYFEDSIGAYGYQNQSLTEENINTIKQFMLMKLILSGDVEEQNINKEGSFGDPIIFGDKSNVIDFMQYLKKKRITIKSAE